MTILAAVGNEDVGRDCDDEPKIVITDGEQELNDNMKENDIKRIIVKDSAILAAGLVLFRSGKPDKKDSIDTSR